MVVVKATRISTGSGAGPLGRHVFEGAENDNIECIMGSRDDLEAMMQDAEILDRQYGIRHVVLAPAEPMTREAALKALEDWRTEFGGENHANHAMVVVEHGKARATDTLFGTHWHAMIAENDIVTGRTLVSAWGHKKNEKQARIIEFENGHAMVRGRHNRAVMNQLIKEGRRDVAEAMYRNGLHRGHLPNSAFMSDAHQVAKRKDVSLSEAKEAVRTCWERADGRRAFEQALAERGYRVARGEKKNTWIIEHAVSATFVGAVHRLVGEKRDRVNGKLQEPQHDHGTQQPPERNRHVDPGDGIEHADNFGPAGGPSHGAGEGRGVAPDGPPAAVAGDERDAETDVHGSSEPAGFDRLREAAVEQHLIPYAGELQTLLDDLRAFIGAKAVTLTVPTGDGSGWAAGGIDEAAGAFAGADEATRILARAAQTAKAQQKRNAAADEENRKKMNEGWKRGRDIAEAALWGAAAGNNPTYRPPATFGTKRTR